MSEIEMEMDDYHQGRCALLTRPPSWTSEVRGDAYKEVRETWGDKFDADAVIYQMEVTIIEKHWNWRGLMLVKDAQDNEYLARWDILTLLDKCAVTYRHTALTKWVEEIV